MNLRSIGDQNPLYRQEVEATCNTLKPEAAVDSELQQKQSATPNLPTPDYEYHEVKLDGTLRPTGDGGVIFRSLSP